MPPTDRDSLAARPAVPTCPRAAPEDEVIWVRACCQASVALEPHLQHGRVVLSGNLRHIVERSGAIATDGASFGSCPSRHWLHPAAALGARRAHLAMST
jgi:hypothetical protein